MQTIILILLSILLLPNEIYAACNSAMSASTPDSQLIDNGDGTVSDTKSGLMWKKCVEGISGELCDVGAPDTFNWQQALGRPGLINSGDGFAGHYDWRLPNIKELFSVVEEKCYNPAINLNRFPNTPLENVWSSTPYTSANTYARFTGFSTGWSYYTLRTDSLLIRLVRSGQ